MPRSLGLSDAVQNFFQAQMLKKDRKRQDLMDQLNEEIARFKLGQNQKDAAQYDEYMTMLDRESTPTFPATGPQTPQPYQMGPADQNKLNALKGIYRYPQEKKPSYQQYELPTSYGAFNPQTGLRTKQGDIEPKSGISSSATLANGVRVSGTYEEVEKMTQQYGVKEASGGDDKPAYSKGASLDDARQLMTVTEPMGFSTSPDGTQKFSMGGKTQPTLQELQPKADSLFNMQNYGQWDAPVQQPVQQSVQQGAGSWPGPPQGQVQQQQTINISEHPELIKAFNDLQRGAINRAKYEDFKMKYLASLEMENAANLR